MNALFPRKVRNAAAARNPLLGAAMAALALAASAATLGVASAATYDASTGYVTMSNVGKDGESPLWTNLVSKSSSDSTQVNAWSDGLAPHSGTNYYAYNKSFRSPKLTSGEFEFAGGRFLMAKSTMWPKTFSPAVMRFPNGVELMDAAVIQINDGGTKSVVFDGPVTFSGASTIYPARNAGDNSSICFVGDASSPADATVSVLQKSPSCWGWFGLLGDTDGFLGTVAVESCGYDMGTNGLPNGSVVFTGTNNVLRLVANPAAAAPVVKTLRFDSAGTHEIRVEVDGVDYGKVRVTNAFFGDGPISIALSGTVSDLGNSRRFEFLRVPVGSLAGVDLSLASLTAGDYTLGLSFGAEDGEDVLAVVANKRVTMSAGGVAGESPLNAAQVTSSGSAVDAWSDGNAPTDSTLCYYAVNRQFRTPALSSGEFEFSGGRFLMTKSTMWPKTFSPAVLRFPHGLEIMDQAVIRINDSGVKNVEIDGPVAFSGTSTIHPAGAVNVESSGIAFLGAAQSGVEAEVAVRPYAEGQRGCFSLAGGTDWFLGKISVRECDYLMGTRGLPYGTLSFATNAVLRLSASGTIPEVKSLSFVGDVASTIEVVCNGTVHGALRVTGAFSSSVPPQVVLSGAMPHEAADLEVLRATSGQFSIADFAPAQSQIDGMSIEWIVAEEAGEQILVAKITPSATVLIMR